MAYLIKITRPKCNDCYKFATYVLHALGGMEHGQFCNRCARKKLRDLKRVEADAVKGT